MDWKCCWNKSTIEPEECPNIAEGDEELYAHQTRRILEKCLECPRFANDLQKMEENCGPLIQITSLLISEHQELKGRLLSMDGFLNSKTREIKFLHELSTVLQTSMDLDEVLSVAMTAITAGKGFGMNRAFLLMTDKERQYLKGYLGVGPRTYDDAWRIWDEVGRSDLTLREMARQFQKNKLFSEKAKFSDILEQLTIPLEDEGHILNRALTERKPILVEDAFHNPQVDFKFAQIIGVDSFLIMPLISGNRRIGIIIADNCITHKRITPQDIQSMETFAFPVAFALVRASLYERLHEEVEKLTAANRKLQEQQELIVKMEKMALVGRITSSIAHSIRNPLTVIGGFARSLLKTIADNDPNREYLQSIVKEALQLEDVLEEVLNYSDSLYPVKDRWDVNQMVINVCQELHERMGQSGVSCTMELAAELPTVFIDYKQVAYCVKTILTTAMELLPCGGNIRMSTRREHNSVVLEITDNGGALSSETMDALTTPFSVTQEMGVGLGLPLCKTILERSDNQFTIENPPEGGKRYTIRLQLVS